MDDKAFERDLEQKLEQTLGDIKPQGKPVQLRPIGQPMTVDDQLVQLERISRSLRDRVRTERLEVIAEYERNTAQLRADCDRKISDYAAQARDERDQELRRLAEATGMRLHQLDKLSDRVDP
jgi:hypothetical protein